ncbi:hypothetical protein BGW80DRAFT_1334525 [Lactifluus volemus]|nr:hypothetical protein BGW80DRAFT_1334525 [Lactifluus volemus]
MGNRRPLQSADTQSLTTVGSRHSYGTIGEHQSGRSSFPKSRSRETYRGGHPLFDVPEEIDEDYLENALEADGLYLGSFLPSSRSNLHYCPHRFALGLAPRRIIPPLILPTPPSTTPHALCFPSPLPELLLSISLFALSHLLNPSLFMLAGVILPHPTAQSVLGTALHVFLRNALRTAAFPTLGLSLPGGIATFRAPAFWHAWWLALGWSLAEVAAGVAQGYETLTLYRDALIPEGRAREIVTSAVTAPAWEPKNNRNESSSPPRAADERLRESLSRGEDGGMSMDISGSPVRGRRLEPSFTSIQIGNDAETQLEVDRDFDELVAVKAREELEDLYGFAPIRVPVFVLSLLRVASILLSLGFVLLLSAGYLTSPLASPPAAEDTTIPPSWSNGMFWGTFACVCSINWALSLLHTPAFLPRVGIHVVAYLGFLIGLGSLFAGLGMWGVLS